MVGAANMILLVDRTQRCADRLSRAAVPVPNAIGAYARFEAPHRLCYESARYELDRIAMLDTPFRDPLKALLVCHGQHLLIRCAPDIETPPAFGTKTARAVSMLLMSCTIFWVATLDCRNISR